MTTAGIAPSPTSESRSIRRYVLIKRDHLVNVTSLEHEGWKLAQPEVSRPTTTRWSLDVVR